MNVPYAVSAAAWSSLGFVLGFVANMVIANRQPREPSERQTPRHRVVTALVVVVTLVSGTQLAWFSYQQRETTECQSKYNQAFIDALRVRSVIADSDRENLSTVVQEIINAKTAEEANAARQRYLDTKARNDAERAQARYPDVPTSAHC